MSDGGVLNEQRLQAQVVRFVFIALGKNAYSPQGLLSPILLAARDLFLPSATPLTLRRWYNHFLKHGELPVETKKARQHALRMCRHRLWTDDNTAALKQIVDDNPEYSLDEIQEAMLGLTMKKWSCMQLWTKLTDKKHGLNYSMQVVTRITGQQDEEERQYMSAINTFALHPSMLHFFNEIEKDRNSAQC
jgi:hypothetical protein